MRGRHGRAARGAREAKYLSGMARAAVTHRANARRARAGVWGTPPEPAILEYAERQDDDAETIIRIYLAGEDPEAPDGDR